MPHPKSTNKDATPFIPGSHVNHAMEPQVAMTGGSIYMPFMALKERDAKQSLRNITCRVLSEVFKRGNVALPIRFSWLAPVINAIS